MVVAAPPLYEDNDVVAILLLTGVDVDGVGASATLGASPTGWGAVVSTAGVGAALGANGTGTGVGAKGAGAGDGNCTGGGDSAVLRGGAAITMGRSGDCNVKGGGAADGDGKGRDDTGLVADIVTAAWLEVVVEKGSVEGGAEVVVSRGPVGAWWSGFAVVTATTRTGCD